MITRSGGRRMIFSIGNSGLVGSEYTQRGRIVPLTDPRDVSPDAQAVIDELLGYLNLSAGTADARFQGNLNALAGWLGSQPGQQPLWEAAKAALVDRLAA